jgi:ankyrin repeat protein
MYVLKSNQNYKKVKKYMHVINLSKKGVFIMRISHGVFLLFFITTYITSMELDQSVTSHSTRDHNSQLKKDLLYHGELGHTHTVQTILSHNIDPNIRDTQGLSLLDYAARYGYIDIVNLLFKHPQFITTDIAQHETAPFQVAIHYNHYAIVERILSQCETIDCTEALCTAIKQKSLCMVRSLLTRTIKKNFLNKLLFLTAKIGDAPIMQLLLENGADINYLDKGWHSLHMAALYNYSSIIRILINHSGEDLTINAVIPSSQFLYEHGYTPLHIAVEANNIPAVQELLEHPAIAINAITKSGYSPLDLAKTDEMRKILIAKGAVSKKQTSSCFVQ